MQNMIKSMYYQMKGISHFIWVPPIVLYILLTTIHYAVYSHNHDMDMLYNNILENAQYMIPLFSIWYVVFLLYHLVEQPGCELLYLTETLKLHNLIVWIFILIVYILEAITAYLIEARSCQLFKDVVEKETEVGNILDKVENITNKLGNASESLVETSQTQSASTEELSAISESLLESTESSYEYE